MREWFFLQPRWIAWGCILTGAFSFGYSLVNVIRYATHGEIRPLFGYTPMAFSTAGLFVLNGLAIFWIGWIMREQTIVRPHKSQAGLTNAQIVQLLLALISASSLLAVALIGALK